MNYRDPRILSAASPILIVCLCLCGCAEIGNPPGGEVDRTGPTLVASYPALGALNVADDDRIVLEFSEAIAAPSSGKAVYISPRPNEEPKVSYKGTRLEIRLPEFFAPDQTYIITVNPGIVDLRNNRLATPVSVAFSTGDNIDSGVVAGVIRDGEQSAPQFVVGLYPGRDLAEGQIYDSIYPRYLTTSDREGRFEFRFLPEGEYRLIAFKDVNRDERFAPLRDAFAVPDRPVIVGGALPLDSLFLPLTSQDTTRIAILSATAQDGLIRLRFSKAVTVAHLLSSPDVLILQPLGDDTTVIPAVGLLEAAQTETDRLTVSFGEVQPGPYRLSFAHEGSRISWDSLEVRANEDKTPPQIIEVMPGDVAVFLQSVDLSILFSEPIDRSALTDQTFTLWTEADELVPARLQWAGPFRLRLLPDDLIAGQRYRLAVTEFDLKDLAGLTVGDSLTNYRFSILDEDSLGSITGSLRVQLPDQGDAPIMLSFRNTASKVKYSRAVPGGPTSVGQAGNDRRAFQIDVPAGKYLLSGFIDRNHDGLYSPGTIGEYQPAETYFESPDTVIVRARFETAGMEVSIR